MKYIVTVVVESDTEIPKKWVHETVAAALDGMIEAVKEADPEDKKRVPLTAARVRSVDFD